MLTPNCLLAYEFWVNFRGPLGLTLKLLEITSIWLLKSEANQVGANSFGLFLCNIVWNFGRFFIWCNVESVEILFLARIPYTGQGDKSGNSRIWLVIFIRPPFIVLLFCPSKVVSRLQLTTFFRWKTASIFDVVGPFLIISQKTIFRKKVDQLPLGHFFAIILFSLFFSRTVIDSPDMIFAM